MTTVFIILLVISQLICFYVIFILNSKISKFEGLEQKQKQLMNEMENTFSVYLLEMKEENDRFLKELSTISPPTVKTLTQTSNEQLQEEKRSGQEVEKAPGPFIKVVPKNIVKNAYKKQGMDMKEAQPYAVKEPEQTITEEMNGQNTGEPDQKVAVKQYEETPISTPEQIPAKLPPTIEERILQLHREGKTIEEIAKMTHKGKTEIELFIKFHA
jgi:hypothetical protein